MGGPHRVSVGGRLVGKSGQPTDLERRIAGLAVLTGIGPTDLLASPAGVLAAIEEIVIARLGAVDKVAHVDRHEAARAQARQALGV